MPAEISASSLGEQQKDDRRRLECSDHIHHKLVEYMQPWETLDRLIKHGVLNVRSEEAQLIKKAETIQKGNAMILDLVYKRANEGKEEVFDKFMLSLKEVHGKDNWQLVNEVFQG